MLLFFCAFLLTFAIHPFFISSTSTRINTFNCSVRSDASQNDCFSWGEDILVDEDPAFSGPEEWKKKCLANWHLKQQGVNDYRKGELDSARKNLGQFIHRKICPNDPEAHIYFSNATAEIVAKSTRKLPLRVAVSLPVSAEEGNGVFRSLQVLRGIALAQHVINDKAGIENRKLIVGIIDDGFRENEFEAAREAAGFLTMSNEIMGIIGHDSSNATEAAARVYDEHKLVSISPTSTAIRTSKENPDGLEIGQHVFRTALPDNLLAEQLAKFIISSEYRRVAIVYDSSSKYSQSFRAAFEKYFLFHQGIIVNEYDQRQDMCDISKGAGFRQSPRDCLNQAMASKAQALLIIPATVPTKSNKDETEKTDIVLLSDFLKAVFREFPSAKIFGSDTMYSRDLLTEEANGMILPLTWHRSSNPNSSEFESYVQKYFSYEDNGETIPFGVDWTAATAYDALQAMAEGLRREMSGQCFFHRLKVWNSQSNVICRRQAVGQALLNTDFHSEGSVGPASVTFDQNGDRHQEENLGVLVKICPKDYPEGEEVRLEFRKYEEC